MFKFLASIISDNGQGSASRVGMLSIIFTACFCVIYIVMKTLKLPDNIGLLTVFVATSVGVIYGINNGKAAMVSIWGKDGPPNQPPA